MVGGIEVSVDGGVTWHPATGRGTWSYSWLPVGAATVTIKSRAADDSANVETPSAGNTVTVKSQACPCSLWPASVVPGSTSIDDSGAVNLGMKFTSDVKGLVSGVRFYKGAGNTGTHVGALWSLSGTLLGSVTFSGETASGWQTMRFASPIQIAANTVYVVSYYAPLGHYAGDNNGFSMAGVDNAPLHALKDGVNGGNGIYLYQSSRGFPNATWLGSNYYVDMIFSPN